MCWIYMITYISICLLSQLWKAAAYLLSTDLTGGGGILWNAWKGKTMCHSAESQHQDLEVTHISFFPRQDISSCTIVPLTIFFSNCLKASIQATKLKISQNLPIMKAYKSFTCKLLIKAIPTVSRIYCWWILGQKANSLAVLLLSP